MTFVARHNVRPRRAAMLLEVVLALSILVASLAAIGIQFNTALRIGHENERMTQALMLAEAKLGQLDTGSIPLELEMYDSFGRTFPGYFWRITIDPHDDIPEMFQVELEILFGDPGIEIDAGDAVESDLDDTTVVARLHTLRPQPATIDMQRDFGFTDEQMDEIAEELPPEIADPANISPAIFAEMDLETLMEVMPQLIEVFGAGFGFDQAQLDQAIQGGLIDPTNLPDNLNDFGTPPGGGRGNGTNGGGGGREGGRGG
jgi:hypothetical protein